MSSFQKKQPIVVKPLCKVCKDAGKCESEYSTHFVKSNPGPKGVIICPTLLAYECTYCRKPGHSVGYCPVLKNKNKDSVRLAAQRKYEDALKTVPNKNKNKNKNNRVKFMALVDSSDDEDEAEDKVVVIALSNKRKFEFSYAEAITNDPVPVVPMQKVVPIQKKRSWADWSDSDDDE